MGTIQAELTAKMIASVKSAMASGASYVAAFGAAVTEHAELVDRVCSGGKRAMSRMVDVAAAVRLATAEAR